jgi:hypothetical protein
MANPRYNKQTTNMRSCFKSGGDVKKKYKGFSKLPENVQMKINKKLAKKV